MNAWPEMLVRISRLETSTLPVINELPDARLAMLEGLNGIGKTLAIRILQICSGQMPYRLDSAEWLSLCDGLGGIEVRVTNLVGAHEIVWSARSEEWAKRPEREPTSDWFREIRVDGNSTTLESVRQLFTVHRLAGDEGIIETFASRADADAAIIRRWSTRYASPSDGPLHWLEQAAEAGRELLGDWSSETYADLNNSVKEVEQKATEAAKAYEAAVGRQNDVTTALTLSKRLEETRLQRPGLAHELDEVDAQIVATRRELETLQEKIRDAAASAARTAPARRELRLAGATLDRNRQKLSAAVQRAAEQATRLLTSPRRDDVAQRLRDLESQADELRREQTALDAAPAMRTLLDDVAQRLLGAESSGLAEEIALDDAEAQIQLSVSRTRQGLRARRAYLEGQPPPSEAREVAARLDAVTLELARARTLSLTLDEVERYQRLVSTNEERVERALRVSNANQTAALHELDTQRRQLDDGLLSLAERRATLATQLGITSDGDTEQALGEQLTALLEAVRLTRDELPAAVASTDHAAEAARVALASTREEAAEARGRLTRAAGDIRRSFAALIRDERLSWLRESDAVPALKATDDIEEALELMDRACSIVDAVIERLTSHRAQLAAVEASLTGLGRQLRGQEPEPFRYIDNLRDWLGARFGEWFNRPGVRHELLPNSTGDVAVDIAKRQVTWQETSGTRARPLEAFSSGEQAFVYTRARLAALDEEISQATNRLIVLDEFGAFIAHDRMQTLLSYLQQRSRERERDQVLVVLPLSRDYADEAAASVGPEAEHWGRLAKEIESRKYAVRVLAK